MPNFEIEKSIGLPIVVGCDEVGRGPWAGPVVAGAVYFPNFQISSELSVLINDSKKMTKKNRELANKLLFESNAIIGIGCASAEEIDKINILQASFLAMKRAIENMKIKPDFVLIDGNKTPDWIIPNKAVIKGDTLSFSISAASIVAKVYRDNLMTELSQQYPDYAWDKNAGYGTKAHIEGLQRVGICPLHRKSYAPIKKIIDKIS